LNSPSRSLPSRLNYALVSFQVKVDETSDSPPIHLSRPV
jgi:hypothetical protein